MGDFMSLVGKVAIITGAAQGIGLEYARGFVEAGAKVVIADVKDGDAAAAELGGGTYFQRADVTSEASVQALADETVRRHGRIDVLVNNAAIYAGIQRRPWDEIPFDEFERMLRVNVTGSWLCARACAQPMKAQKSGAIVNVASGVAFTTPAGTAHYNVSKAAVIGLTRTLAKELGDWGVRVNSISPGLVWNESSRGQTPPEYGDRIAQTRCIKRHLNPDDLVGTVLYLASDAARFVTGQNVLVDGGAVFH